MRFYYAKKESYTGRWLNSMRHGYGKFTYHDGAVYEGRWEADLRHGQAAGGKPTGKADFHPEELIVIFEEKQLYRSE